jgi:protein DEK
MSEAAETSAPVAMEQDEETPKEVEEDGEASPDEAEPSPKAKRQRKTVERISYDDEKKEKAAFSIPEGPGTKVADLPNVCHWLEKKKADEWTILHRLMFGVRGKNINTKKNIRQFSGFPADQAESLKEKRGEILNKQILSQLKTLADHLDIEVTGTKQDYMDAILEFLVSPSASGEDGPRGLPRKKSATKKKTAPKTKAAKKSKSKAKKTKKALPVYPSLAPKSAVVLFATSIKSEVMGAHPDLDSIGLLAKCREQFNALGEAETQKWARKAKAAKDKYDRELDAYEAAQLDLDSGDESEEESKPKKKRAPKKRKQAESSDEASDSSSDDEPLVKKPRKGPSEAVLRKAIQDIIDAGNLEEMTKKKVRKAVQAQFPDEDLEDFKEYLNETIIEIVTSKTV